MLEVAIDLLGACSPRNDHATYQFIHHNAARMTPEHRRAVVRLVVDPRRGPDGLTDVLGWVAIQAFPEARELQTMWCRWIESGAFDGDPKSADDLAHYFADAGSKGLQGWEPMHESLRSYARGLLRSGDKQKVDLAVLHLIANADHDTPALRGLLGETNGVAATYEWERWQERDPEAALEMEWWVFAHREQALGERDWLEAMKTAKDMFDFHRERREKLAARAEPSE